MKQIITILTLLFTVNSFGQTPAFPCAYGGGAYAVGGRGGNVYHVTSLEDPVDTSGNPLSPVGTFRWALNQPRPATIVFDVSGIIVIQNWLDFDANYLTIAGQSAPVGGITIVEKTDLPGSVNNFAKRFRVRGDSEHGIIRYLRVRPLSEANTDAFELYASNYLKDIIIDHCSVSYGGDEGFSLRVDPNGTIDGITFQRSILAENKTGSLFGTSWDETTGQASITNQNLSWLNNLSFNNSHRSPNVTTNGRFDYINNIVHNWEDHVGAMYGDIKANIINNYFSLGEKATFSGLYPRYTWKEHNGWSIEYFEDSLTGSFAFNPEVYIEGNFADKDRGAVPENVNTDNWNMMYKWADWRFDTLGARISNVYRTTAADTQYRSSTPFPQINNTMPIQSATDAFNDVRTNSGANASLNADGTVTYYTDVQDTEYLSILADSVGSNIHYDQFDQHKPYQYNPTFDTFQLSVNSTTLPPINTRPGNFYVSNPHIPEIWFLANVPAGEDHNDTTADGYTWLEMYLNQVDTCGGGGSIVINPCTGTNPPVATIAPPIGSLSKYDTLSFGVSYTSDTTVISVDYYINDSLLANTTTPFTLDTTLPQGTYSVRGVLTDECGNISSTDTVTINVEGIQVIACKTNAIPVIDGIEDVLWTTIASHKLDVTQNGLTLPDSNDLSANYKIIWDATSLYFFITVKDDTLVMDSPQLEFFRDDAPSIFIDALDNDSPAYDANDFNFGFKQGTSDIVVNNALYTGSAITKSDVVTSEGYTMEVKIDWAYLGLTPTVGNNIGLDFRVDDDDDGGSREHHLLWNDETSTLWANPSKFGVLMLSNTICFNTTSIELETKEGLLVYPNPTTGELTISSEHAINKIEVYNALGSLVLLKDNIGAKSKELNISILPKGVYSVKVYEANRVIEKQVIKQ